MKQIQLTQGKWAKVDDEDYGWLSQWKWHVNKIGKNYYAMRKSPMLNGKQTTVLMHRALLGLVKGDVRQADHIFHDTLDNSKDNLRIASNAQNSYNQIACEGSSIFKGVDYHKLTKKWRSRIMVDGIQKHLGLFEDEVSAAKAYDKAALRYFGEYAFLNFPPNKEKR